MEGAFKLNQWLVQSVPITATRRLWNYLGLT